MMPTPPFPPLPPIPPPVPGRDGDAPFVKVIPDRLLRARREKAKAGAAPVDAEQRRREWSGFVASFLVHSALMMALALVVMPVEQLVPALTIVSSPLDEDTVVEIVPIEMKEHEIKPVERFDRQVDAIAPPVGTDADLALEGAANALADESLLGVPALVDNVSFETSDMGSLVMTLGQGEAGNGLDADGVGAKITFYGVQASGRRFVFVTDCSSSMSGLPIQRLKEQLRETIGGLPPQAEFYIVFFNSGPVPMPSSRPAKATPALKRKYLDWADQVPSDGGTDPSGALEIALKLRPSVVFLLTDGVFPPEPTFAAINRLNKARKTQINTIAIGVREAESVLQQIAEENKGTYTFVPHQ